MPSEEEKRTPHFVSPDRRAFARRRVRLPKGIVWGLAGLAVFFVAGSLISFYVVRARVKSSVASDADGLRAGLADLENLDPSAAAQEFSSLGAASGTGLGGVLDGFVSLFEGGANAVSSFSDLSTQLSLLSQEAGALGTDPLGFMASGNGSTTIVDLKGVQATLGAIDGDMDGLSGFASFAGGASALGVGNSYLSFRTQLTGAEQFLNAFIPWLSNPAPHHVLVLFENPSELRPGGGFVGSYADIALADGDITGISVHDVADVDSTFHGKIIPPLPLQLEVTGLRPADGNWFFDFPTSASETISLFDASSLYADSSTTFDAAIAVSPQVVSDLLSLTGPLTVSPPGTPPTTFTSANLLVQIQKIVQAGHAQSATYPKAILGQLAKAIFAELVSSPLSSSTPSSALSSSSLSSSSSPALLSTADSGQAPELLALAEQWIADKDLMFYSSDPAMENFTDNYGADGAQYELPQNFNGDYLALADTDVNSDKSQLYVSSTVDFVSQLNADGTVNDELTITRAHHGNQSPYWWYRTSNQDYLQVFLPPDAVLTNESGGVVKKIASPVNYAARGYTTDSLVFAIASDTQSLFGYPAILAHQESGKEVFATWSTVHAGASITLSFNYTHRLFLAPADGETYQFIFEKQPGAVRTYNFEIDAPLGFVFAENGLSSYTYTSSDPPGRLVFDLTLKKITE